MANPEWADYSGAPPILLPVSLLPFWQGFFLPAAPDEQCPRLVLPEGAFVICDDFDFDNPKTDYDRACALGGIPPVHTLPVGPGLGLVLVTEMDQVTWQPESLMVINGGDFPLPERLARVEWSDECVWIATEPDFVLMNACDHGAALQLDHFDVRLEPGKYSVQYGRYGYGWGYDVEAVLILFRFVKQD